MYLFEIVTSNNKEMPLLEKAFEETDIDGANKIYKKNWDGDVQVIQFVIPTLIGIGIPSFLKFIHSMYRLGLVKVKYKGFEIECHKNELEDVEKFIKHLIKISEKSRSKNK